MAIDSDGPTSDPLSQPSRMLALFSIPEPRWQPSELGEILAHQLDMRLCEMNVNDADGSITLRQLLSDDNPSIAMLHQIKRVFKDASQAKDSLLPTEVATVLYIAVIVAGLRGGHAITKLDDTSLRERIDWAIRRPWLDPTLRKSFEEKQLRAGS